MIAHRGKQWILYTHDGSRVLGRHPTRAAALRQERAIYAAKARRNPSYAVPYPDVFVAHDARQTQELIEDLVRKGHEIPFHMAIGLPHLMADPHAVVFTVIMHPNGGIELMELRTVKPTPLLRRKIHSAGLTRAVHGRGEPFWYFDERFYGKL